MIQRKVFLWLEVCNVGVLLHDLNDLDLDKSEVFRSVFQLLSKDLGHLVDSSTGSAM